MQYDQAHICHSCYIRHSFLHVTITLLQLLRSFKGPGYLYTQRKLQFLMVHCFWYDETIFAGLGELEVLDRVFTV